jgi:hypothetical protein
MAAKGFSGHSARLSRGAHATVWLWNGNLAKRGENPYHVKDYIILSRRNCHAEDDDPGFFEKEG